MTKYTFTISFVADRDLTKDELDTLNDTLCLQIVEPQILSDFGYEDAEYKTSAIAYEIKKENLK